MSQQTSTQSYETQLFLRIVCCMSMLIPIIIFPTVGKNTRKSSNKYILQVTPPPPFFRIWIIIEVLFDIIAIYAVIYDLWSSTSWILYALVNIICGIWTLVFTKNTIFTNNVSLLLTIGLLISNQLLWNDLTLNPKLEHFDGLLTKNIFSFGQGWFIAATNLSIGLILIYTLGLTHKLQTIIFWVMVPLAYLTAIWYTSAITESLSSSIGMIVSGVYAITGAVISTFRPLKISKQD